VVVTEIFPLSIRGLAVGVATFVNRLVSGAVAVGFMTLIDTITEAGTFFLFAGLAVCGFVFTLCVVPETKGRSLEELQAELTKGQGDTAVTSPTPLEENSRSVSARTDTGTDARGVTLER